MKYEKKVAVLKHKIVKKIRPKKRWILFGILAGINLLNKYIAGFMLLSILVFVLCDKKGRSLFLNYKSYISVFICLSMLVPHIWWLYENDFEMLNYILFRNKEFINLNRFLLYYIKILIQHIP